MKSAAFLATRRELVPTTRTASRGRSRSRSANRASAGKRALLRFGVEVLVGGQSGGQPHRLAQAVQHVELVVLDARDLQAKAVGAQINRGEYRL